MLVVPGRAFSSICLNSFLTNLTIRVRRRVEFLELLWSCSTVLTVFPTVFSTFHAPLTKGSQSQIETGRKLANKQTTKRQNRQTKGLQKGCQKRKRESEREKENRAVVTEARKLVENSPKTRAQCTVH